MIDRGGVYGRGNAGYYLILILGGIPFSKNAGYDRIELAVDRKKRYEQDPLKHTFRR